MELDIYQISAFTNQNFRGNPACVVPLKEWLSDDILLKIATENAVAETAFFVFDAGKIHLRWFTPEFEMDLCGHATLATAFVLKTILNESKSTLVFTTLSGDLAVTSHDDLYTLDFPSRKAIAATLPQTVKDAISIQPKLVLKSRDYVLVYDSQTDIENIQINRAVFDQINLDPGGIIVTAKGNDCDFVSRFFTPQASILEDPVTGSAHCTLIPYWSEVLQKNDLIAKQISAREGYLICKDLGNRVHISGKAICYLKGKIYL